jgi:Tol biopolymer transport system component
MKIKLTTTVFLIAALSALFSIAEGAPQVDDPGVLLRAAIEKEEVDGDLQGAIDLYKEIISKYGGNQAIAAKAQLRIGYCYEKMGLMDAQKAFQKVIDNYPGQEKAVKEARDKLSILLRAQAVIKEEDKRITMRKLTEPRMAGGWGAPSPDGRYFAFYFDPPADLAVRDFETGEIRRLNMNDVPKYGFGAVSNSCWSPDGKQIAFGQRNRRKNLFAVRAVNFDGSNARTVYKNTHWIDPYAWSPDGKTILTYLSKGNDGDYRLGLLQVDNGTLLEYDFSVSPSPSSGFSPDSSYLALSVPQKNGSKGHDVSLFSISEEKVIPLIEHPANDRVVGWAPDGKWIFFWSDRTGSADLWAIRISDGKAQGDPVLIQKDMGGADSMWMTPAGSLFYSMQISTRDVYVAKIDFDQNKILNGPKKATQQYTYRNYAPSWSLDGEYLAFFSNKTPGRALCVLSQKTGEVRTFPLELISFMNPAWVHWSPDGQSIVHTGFDKPGSAGFFRTDTKTGKMKMIFPFAKNYIRQIWGSRFSRDGNTMFDVKHDKNTKKSLIVAQNLATQTINELYVVSDWIHGLALSPDEKQFAFFEGRFRLGNMKIKIFPVDREESRILHTFEKGEWLVALDWTPDGRNILFSKGKRVDEKWVESLWNISLKGGKPQQVEMDMASIENIQIHPDGQQIAFESGRGGQEIWVIENILSVLEDRK